MQTHVHRDSLDTAVRLTLRCDEPSKPPTLDLLVLDELQSHLTSDEVLRARAVVFRTESEKYFVVGANVSALQQLGPDSIEHWIRRGHEVFSMIEQLPVPTIAAVHGFALGGGLELAMACDMIVASAGAQFGLPEASLGLIPGWGGTRRLPARVGKSAASMMMLTGRIIPADVALRIGLIDLLADDKPALDAEVTKLLEQIASLSAPALSEIKRILAADSIADPLGCLQLEQTASKRLIDLPATQQRLHDFFAKRKRR